MSTNSITHHVSDDVLLAYVSGHLPQPYAVVIASHLSLCDDCRARSEAHAHAGGVVMETGAVSDVSAALKSRLFDELDAVFEQEPEYEAKGPYPAPVMAALGGAQPRWKHMGLGTKQAILQHDKAGSVRLLYIPGGMAVPDHGHNGLELTLVLQGAFRDETGRYGVGDLETADGSLEHTPIAEPGEACICLAATDAQLRFLSLVPRLLQPIFRI
ncbi:ChrR family anti-sigma-E factor [Celeribacter baekdonensis]|jgi:putative transcriptional regulator|uniref:Transcriptional regulator n=1 Tax=Celeribacter baekdonensis TaxID=875171 RepID=A0A2R4LZG5_9RHOB|nr:ChrR family anti-sigma-E factor [Celeribacter baekdonensis]AVW90315.1 transcriptional regulator [Celeribacter baekdonensis]